MSSMLTRLTDTTYKPSFWEAFWERWLPLSRVEAEAVLAIKARAEADTALFKAEADRIEQQTNQARIIFEKEQRDRDLEEKGRQIVLQAKVDEEKEAKRVREILRPIFVAKLKFRRGDKDNFMLVIQCGQSKDQLTRGIMSYKVMNPRGAPDHMSDSTKQFFQTSRLWTNLVYPWTQYTISTDDVKEADFTTVANDGTLASWVEFPLETNKPKGK